MTATNINRDPKMVNVSYRVHKSKANQDMITTILLKLSELVNGYHDFPIVTDGKLDGDWWLINISVARDWTIREEEWWGRFRKSMEQLAKPPEGLLN